MKYWFGLLCAAVWFCGPALEAVEWQSRQGFRTELPELWRVGAAALDDPAWDALTAEQRTQLLAALTPPDAEVIMTGAPLTGFNHLTVRASAESFPWQCGTEELRELFAAGLTDGAELRRIESGTADGKPLLWLLVATADAKVLYTAYWQIAPQNLINFTLFGDQAHEEAFTRDFQDMLRTLAIVPEAQP